MTCPSCGKEVRDCADIKKQAAVVKKTALVDRISAEAWDSYYDINRY